MNDQFIEARELIVKAREALRRGDRASARQLGEQAALLAPTLEDAWLVLTASDPDPREALAYAQKARELNPQSERTRRGVEWAATRLKQAEGHLEPSPQAPLAQTQAEKDQSPVSPKVIPTQAEAVASLPASLSQKHAYQTVVAVPQLKSNGRNWLLPALLAGAGLVLVGFIALFAMTSPALASIVSNVRAPAPTQENLWAPAEIAKPAMNPIDAIAFAAQAADTPTNVPTEVPAASISTDAPTLAPTDVPTEAPVATETPGVVAMEAVPDTPTSEYIAPVPKAPDPALASSGNGDRWIDVDLTNQSVYAYEGDVLVNSFIVSTGT